MNKAGTETTEKSIEDKEAKGLFCSPPHLGSLPPLRGGAQFQQPVKSFGYPQEGMPALRFLPKC